MMQPNGSFHNPGGNNKPVKPNPPSTPWYANWTHWSWAIIGILCLTLIGTMIGWGMSRKTVSTLNRRLESMEASQMELDGELSALSDLNTALLADNKVLQHENTTLSKELEDLKKDSSEAQSLEEEKQKQNDLTTQADQRSFEEQTAGTLEEADSSTQAASSDTQSTQESSRNSPQTTVSSTAETASKPGIGETITNSSLSATLDKVSLITLNGEEYLGVDITLKNESDKEEYFSFADIKLVNAKGEEIFSSLPEGIFSLLDIDEEFSSINVFPGGSHSGWLVFQTAIDKNYEYRLIIYDPNTMERLGIFYFKV